MLAAAILAMDDLADTVIFLQLRIHIPIDTIDDPGLSMAYP